MMRSLFSGVTGLRSHQTRLDVIGNNIANVNTTGYKKAVVTFNDLYSETISSAASATSTTGGVNAKMIGLGVGVGNITKVHTAGSTQYTGNSMDAAISGDGYFVVSTPDGLQYTRAGNFSTDLTGNLINGTGYYVQVTDPSVTSSEKYTINGMNTDSLFVANTKIGLPSGSVHTGTVTADLSTVDGMEYGFKYFPDGYQSNITTRYRPSLPTSTGMTTTGELTMAGIAEKALEMYNAEPPTFQITAPGKQNITFNYDSANNKMQLLVGGTAVADADVTGTGLAATNGNATLDFGPGIGELTITNANPEEKTWADAATDLGNLQNLPSIPFSEKGEWYMVDASNPTTKIEKAILTTANAGADVTGVNPGTLSFATTSYGTFRMSLSESMEGMSALSDELSSSLFTIDVAKNNVADYAAAGVVDESSLHNLQVDFTKYTNLTVDSTGAVIAQLREDDELIIGDKTIQRSMGDKVVLGYISLATFNNPSGLEQVGDNLYNVSANSGSPEFSSPGTGNAGSLTTSNLEMSNVDLSEEMVNMIVTQRGFQANSRIITTSDTMLEELVNLKR